MICTILAAVDGSPCGRVAGQYASFLASRLNAGVDALTVIDIRPLEGPMLRDFTAHLGLEPFEAYTQALRDVLGQHAEEVLEQFREDAKLQGLDASRIASLTEVGIVPETVCRRATRTDLAVLGQFGEYRGAAGGLLGPTSEQVVRRATRPVMVCPEQFLPISRPMVAYDGTALADSALHFAADFAAQLSVPLSVVTINDDYEVDEETASAIGQQAQRYLENAHIDMDVVTVSGKPEEAIIEHAHSGNHDLIVMGAFGHSRIRDLFIGSVTSHVMRNSDVPVLLTR
jgi:nucleotide-binding universal stress UspA family protein